MKATIKLVRDKVNKQLLKVYNDKDQAKMCQRIKKGDWFRTYAELGSGKLTKKAPQYTIETIQDSRSFDKFFGTGAEDKSKWKVLEEEFKMSNDGNLFVVRIYLTSKHKILSMDFMQC